MPGIPRLSRGAWPCAQRLTLLRRSHPCMHKWQRRENSVGQKDKPDPGAREVSPRDMTLVLTPLFPVLRTRYQIRSRVRFWRNAVKAVIPPPGYFDLYSSMAALSDILTSSWQLLARISINSVSGKFPPNSPPGTLHHWKHLDYIYSSWCVRACISTIMHFIFLVIMYIQHV